MKRTGTKTAAGALLVAAMLATGACSSSKSSGSAATGGGSETTVVAGATAAGAKLRILVTNDDGYSAPGIDNVVEALRKLPDVEVTVVAPKTNESGTGARTTPGRLTTEHLKTQSGYPAVAVAGYPADTIRVALDDLHLTPDVVVSGVNLGQNDGALIDISGTVGAARAAARRGIPAIAASQGLGPHVDFPVATALVVDYITKHRTQLHALPRKPATVININAPSCATGKVRGTVGVPPAPGSDPQLPAATDCTGTAPLPTGATDVVAMAAGYAVVAQIPAEPAG